MRKCPIGANVQAVLRRYQGLKVTEPTQWFAGHERLPGIAAEPMKPIVALGAKDPYSRIGVSVRRRCNSRTAGQSSLREPNKKCLSTATLRGLEIAAAPQLVLRQ